MIRYQPERDNRSVSVRRFFDGQKNHGQILYYAWLGCV